MGWEWVAPAGTAVVGITSVVATFAASRSSQRREDRAAARQRAYAIEDARRAERKEMFLRFLAALGAVEAAAGEVRKRHEAGEDTGGALLALDRATDMLVNDGFAINLVTGAAVTEQLGKVTMLALDIQVAVEADPTAPSLVDGASIAKLVMAMADELRLNDPTL